MAGVESVTEDAGLTLASTEISDQAAEAGSLYTIANKVTGASTMWDAGYTGKGVDVAVIDSGIVPVDGLNTRDKVVYGPDLTLEASTRGREEPGHVRPRHAHVQHHRRPRRHVRHRQR